MGSHYSRKGYKSKLNLPPSVLSRLVRLLNAICWMQCFPPAWKEARVFSILNPVKDPALSFF